jgi:mRNA interferase RelE/StbE
MGNDKLKYEVVYSSQAMKSIHKLNRSVAVQIKSWIMKNLINTDNPRQHGKALVGDMAGFWRYRVGDYRIICEIQDSQLIIQVIKIGHRSKIYE